jgi:hypothetical protein
MSIADLDTAARLAAPYGVTKATVHAWCRAGRVAAVKQGRRWLIDATVTADLSDEQARVVVREAVVAYRKQATMPIPAPDAPLDAKVAFSAAMDAVGIRRQLALAKLRTVGRGKVVEALVEEAACKGIGSATAEHRGTTARRVIAAALAPAVPVAPADAFELFDAMSRRFPRHPAPVLPGRFLKAGAGRRSNASRPLDPSTSLHEETRP